ncbi:PIN-like domain-containing protein [Pseudomonas nitroreducens]|uniref:PIN-like domain-containing protein n=1 Tax=Pseudomonas nitroreducens TaxID=46680 RepID=UPI003CC81603
MRNKFPGHFASSTTDFDKLWDQALVVLDANVLLNFYRYSDSTRDSFIGTLREFKGRLWVPHRAAYEYFSNRLDVIGQQKKKYDETLKDINKLKKDLEGSRQHPFVSETVLSKAQVVFDELEQELKANRDVHDRRVSNDEVMVAIDDLVGDEVGDPYTEEKHLEIIKSGEARYREKRPPGYMDGKSKKPESEALCEQLRPYGDYVVWLQILDKAKADNKPVILVTDDSKEDWWEVSSGRTVGPRPELVEEFKASAEQDFFMYQPDQFLSRANERLNRVASKEALQEIQDVSGSAPEDPFTQGYLTGLGQPLESYPWETLPWDKEVNRGGLRGKDKQTTFYDSEIASLTDRIVDLKNYHNHLRETLEGSPPGVDTERLLNEMARIRQLIMEAKVNRTKLKKAVDYLGFDAATEAKFNP